MFTVGYGNLFDNALTKTINSMKTQELLPNLGVML